jgi:hypothetical protein
MSMLRKLKAETILPRVLALLGSISLLVYIFTSTDDGHFTYSRTSYVALGAVIGFDLSCVISMVAIRLSKDRKQVAGAAHKP